MHLNKKIGFITVCMCLVLRSGHAQSLDTVYVDFSEKSGWWQEVEYPDNSWVYTDGDELFVEAYGGATIWLDTLLQGDYAIEYQRLVVVDGGKYDRVSDLNQFWLAHEPGQESELFDRDGQFSAYDDLDLFYVGMGGNYNSTTRFRRYDGKGNRILLEEKNYTPYLLEPNRVYSIKTIVKPSIGYTGFFVNDHPVFEYHGEVGDKGYFGFRLTASRQRIRQVKIYRLPDSE